MGIEGSPSKDAQLRRSRVNGRFMFTVVGLAATVLLSLAVLSNSSTSAASWQFHSPQPDSVVPGRRHRKLEREPGLDQEQFSAGDGDEEQHSAGAGDQEQLSAGDDGGGKVEGGDADTAQDDEGAETEQRLAAGAGSEGLIDSSGAETEQPIDADTQQGAAEAAKEAHTSKQQQQEQQQEQQQQKEQAVAVGEAAAQAAEQSAVQAAEVDTQTAAAQAAEQAAAQAAAAEQAAAAAQAALDDGYEQEQQPDAPGHKAKRRKKSAYHRALERCVTLACLQEAAQQERYKGQFLFPHFFILGWQKSATTSLFHHLKDHPEVLMPVEKEPEFFSYDCGYDARGCPPEMQQEYIEETLHLSRALRHNLNRATFEGSTHYAREGQRLTPNGDTFAASMYKVLPWVRLIASMREPISRYLSMLGHNLDKNTYTCLNKHDSLFKCLELELPWNNYSMPIQSWLDAFPKEQLLLLQYESLTAEDKEAEHLTAVKSFLGVDPKLPAVQLAHSNTRADRLGHAPEGWPMLKWQYERLIEVVRPDVDSLADILTKYGLADANAWVAEWEKAWQTNLDACTPDGKCSIQ